MKKYFLLPVIALSLAFSGALSALALDQAGPNGFYATSSNPEVHRAPTISTLDIACVKTAVEKREDAIQAAFDAFSSAYKSALSARKADLSAAWSIADRKVRNLAIQAAWLKFRQSRHDARKTYNASRGTAWGQFITDRKTCGSEPTGENQWTDNL